MSKGKDTRSRETGQSIKLEVVDSGRVRDDAEEAAVSEDQKAEMAAAAIREAIEQQAREDEKPHSSSFTLRQILGGDFLSAKLMRQNIGLILVVVVFLLVSISNRYSVQKKLVEIDKLNTQLHDAKYRALSTGSQLTERTRQRYVLDALRHSKDSVLKQPDHPPFKVQVPEE